MSVKVKPMEKALVDIAAMGIISYLRMRYKLFAFQKLINQRVEEKITQDQLLEKAAKLGFSPFTGNVRKF